MHKLCYMCGNTRRDKVRNEDIRTKIGVVSIEEKMRENCLRWFDMCDVELQIHQSASRAYQIRTN